MRKRQGLNPKQIDEIQNKLEEFQQQLLDTRVMLGQIQKK